jgi:hypothetical protein
LLEAEALRSSLFHSRSFQNGQGREADHSPPSNAEVKNGGAIPPLPNVSSWRGAYWKLRL